MRADLPWGGDALNRKIFTRTAVAVFALGLLFVALQWVAQTQAPFELTPEPAAEPVPVREPENGDLSTVEPSPAEIPGSPDEESREQGARIELRPDATPPAEPVFAARPQPDPRERREAERAWRRELEQRLEQPGSAQRRDAAARLGDLGDPEALPRLRQLARSDDDIEVRRLAVSGLGRSTDPADLDLLREVIDTAENTDLRYTAELSIHRIRQAIDWGKDVLEVQLTPLNQPRPGEQGRVQLDARVLARGGDVALGFDLPDGVRRISGEDHYQGRVAAGFARRLVLEFQADTEGDYAFAGSITLKDAEGNRYTRTRRYTLRIGALRTEWIESPGH